VNEFVNIRPLKEIALKMKDPVRMLILSESDLIARDEYFIKIEAWLKILSLTEKENEKNDE